MSVREGVKEVSEHAQFGNCIRRVSEIWWAVDTATIRPQQTDPIELEALLNIINQ